MKYVLSSEEALQYMREREAEYMKPARKKGYICPACGNGSGQDGTGITEDPHNAHRFKCFKCGYYGDIVDYIATENGINPADSATAFAKAREVFGIAYEAKEPYKPAQTLKTPPVDPPKAFIQDEAEHKKIEAYINKKAFNELPFDMDGEGEGSYYLQARGINGKTAARLRFGYADQYNETENGKQVTASELLIIPYTNSLEKSIYYTKRWIRAEGKEARYFNYKGGRWGIFNEAALYEHKSPVFVFEGAIDAATVIEVSGESAVAIMGAANADKFLSYLQATKGERPENSFILVRDADEGGESFTKLLEGLQTAGNKATLITPEAPYKDINEMLQAKGRKEMKDFIERAVSEVNAEALKQIKAHSAGNLLNRLNAYIKDTKEKPPVKTGYKAFDYSIGGGLYPRLYVVGAASSVGKTSFILQAADYIAASGNPVIIFSLEMSTEEIIGRSISRRTFLKAVEAGNNKLAKTELGITAGHRYKDYSESELDIIRTAWKDYEAEEGENLIIYDGNRTIDEIRKITAEYISFTGRTPTVIIDYLQFLEPAESVKKAQIREQVNYDIQVITQMKRELKTPLIVISAFNRGSYTGTADNSSFKESGNIEYSADCTITLELDKTKGEAGSNDAKQSFIAGMREDTRKVKLTFQKNRSGRVGSTIYLKYLPKFNLFEEDQDRSEY